MVDKLDKFEEVDALRPSGACGYGSLVDIKPLRARVGAVSPVMFMYGEGCGACYKVRCPDRSICFRRAVNIIVTDKCLGGGSTSTLAGPHLAAWLSPARAASSATEANSQSCT
ncbi:hypothetical protein CRG98_043019 [Punica granatum]|uniref:Expansin-like EG45 domain-containing protein n=1 Tax=Punica granatum TaxID=22663 RepID=A0A2I0HY24_PUNGR|nr:hypothetical protein CRG98_043019 [Punica granatum]